MDDLMAERMLDALLCLFPAGASYHVFPSVVPYRDELLVLTAVTVASLEIFIFILCPEPDLVLNSEYVNCLAYVHVKKSLS